MKAWECIEQAGWWQASESWRDGRLCIFMAIRRAYEGDSTAIMEGARKVARHVAGGDSNILQVYAWNDTPQRTQAEVVILLKELNL